MTTLGPNLDGIRHRSARMKTIATSSGKSIRLAVLVAAFSIGGIGGFANGDVAADTLIPREDTGGPGGGGGSAIVLLAADPADARVQICPPCATP